MSEALSKAVLLARRPADRSRAFLLIASASLFVGGYEHLSLYRHSYHAIPKIGLLFAANVAASAVVGVALIFRNDLLVRLAALAVPLTTLGFFVASRLPGGVFNFQEQGLQPSPQAAVTLTAELIAVGALGVTFIRDR